MANISVKNVFEEENDEISNVFYLSLPERKRIYFYSNTSSSVESFLNRILNFCKMIFLPEGFPESVSKDYIPYQFWDTIQAFSSSITGTLSTHAILTSVGVGNENASPLSATITWILKDGTGHIGRIIFAWWKGSDLDINSKQWRMVADIFNDLALGIEVFLLPSYSTWSTQILCLTTAIKSVVGVAGGATRAALTQHHAIRGNLADVSAKDGSQETFVNLCASMFSVVILVTITNKMTLLLWFMLFTALHLYANYKAVKSIRLSVLNTNRLLTAYSTYMKTKKVTTIEETNEKEPIISHDDFNDQKLCGHNIKLGKPLKEIIKNDDLTNLIQAKHIYKDVNFCLNVFGDCIYISFKKQHSSEDVLQAYFHALIVGIMKQHKNSRKKNEISYQIILRTCGIDVTLPYEKVFQQSCLAWIKLKEALENEGWTTKQHLLPLGGCKAIW